VHLLLSVVITLKFRSAMQKIISSVKSNDLLDPMNKVAAERQVLKQKGMPRSYSIYRDILFLAFAALERENIDQGTTDI
jgi:DENN domain-containing protein 4